MQSSSPINSVRNKRRRRWCIPILLALPFSFTGCSTVPAYEQVLLGKPNLQFGDSLTYETEPRFQSGFEPGSPSASGAGATGCAACQ